MIPQRADTHFSQGVCTFCLLMLRDTFLSGYPLKTQQCGILPECGLGSRDCCCHINLAAPEHSDPCQPRWLPGLFCEERAVFELVSPTVLQEKMNNYIMTK